MMECLFAALLVAGILAWFWWSNRLQRAKTRREYAIYVRDMQGAIIDMYIDIYHRHESDEERLLAKRLAFECLTDPNFIDLHTGTIAVLQKQPELYDKGNEALHAIGFIEAVAVGVAARKAAKQPIDADRETLIRRNDEAKKRPTKLLPGGLWACGACGSMLDGDQEKCTCGPL